MTQTHADGLRLLVGAVALRAKIVCGEGAGVRITLRVHCYD